MNEFITFNISDIMPSEEAILKSQGIHDTSFIDPQIFDIVNESVRIFEERATPVGMIKEISVQEFEPIFIGEGENAEDAPLAKIYPKADHLALFALTMGEEVSAEIQELFDGIEFAFGYMLDSVASLAADKAVTICEKLFLDDISDRVSRRKNHYVLSYSPGYCGWDISAQKKLFEVLQPEKIGIRLNDSYLMTPLKSVSGVLIDGKKEIHIFENNFDFCESCKTHSCRERIKRVLATNKTDDIKR